MSVRTTPSTTGTTPEVPAETRSEICAAQRQRRHLMVAGATVIAVCVVLTVVVVGLARDRVAGSSPVPAALTGPMPGPAPTFVSVRPHPTSPDASASEGGHP